MQGVLLPTQRRREPGQRVAEPLLPEGDPGLESRPSCVWGGDALPGGHTLLH